jgi:hypothetical protein
MLLVKTNDRFSPTGDNPHLNSGGPGPILRLPGKTEIFSGIYHANLTHCAVFGPIDLTLLETESRYITQPHFHPLIRDDQIPRLLRRGGDRFSDADLKTDILRLADNSAGSSVVFHVAHLIQSMEELIRVAARIFEIDRVVAWTDWKYARAVDDDAAAGPHQLGDRIDGFTIGRPKSDEVVVRNVSGILGDSEIGDAGKLSFSGKYLPLRRVECPGEPQRGQQPFVKRQSDLKARHAQVNVAKRIVRHV